MKKCLKCGAELDDGANFCRYCGSSQKVDSAEAIAQGYYAPNGMSQDYYDPNGTAQGYYAPNDMAQHRAIMIQMVCPRVTMTKIV